MESAPTRLFEHLLDSAPMREDVLLLRLLTLPPYPRAIQRRRQLLLGVYLVLALLYLGATPAWEASDEPWHYGMVNAIATTGELPVQKAGVKTAWEQEGSQPPLYYALVALMVAPIDRSEPAQEFNPHAKIGIGLASDNQNMLLHEQNAWQGAILATMIGRGFSILLGAGTVWLVFAVALLTAPKYPQVALLAMELTVFNPMFLFISASLNNDNLVIFLGTAILALLLNLWRNGWQWRTIGIIACLLGLAALTKLSGLTFAPLVGLMILLVHRREKRPWRDFILAGVACVGSILLIAGWWYGRNLNLYGDLTGLNTMVDIAGHRPNGFGIWDLWAEREGFYYAYWGWFGGLNVLSPSVFFTVTLVLVGVGVVGLLIHFLAPSRDPLPSPLAKGEVARNDGESVSDSNSDRILALLLILQIIIVFIGVVRWTLQTPASQGRLMFPVIAAISTLLAIGLHEVLRRVKIPSFSAVLPLAMFAVALPIITIRPAYMPDAPIDKLPDDVKRVDVQFGAIQLLGYEIERDPVEVHENEDSTVAITLYWRPTAQTEHPLSFYVQIFAPTDDPDPAIVGKLDSYPSRGLRRTDTWEINKIYAETYHIPLLDNADEYAPFEPRFKIGWRDHAANLEIPATTLDNAPIEAVIVRGGGVWAECEEHPSTLDVRWSGLARLDAIESPSTITTEAGASFPIEFAWSALDETPDSYTLFVQLLGADNQQWGSGDGVPRQDWYPTTAWHDGACWQDSYTVQVSPDAPSGEYRLVIGFYRPDTGQRLPVDVKRGKETPFPDAYVLDVNVHVE